MSSAKGFRAPLLALAATLALAAPGSQAAPADDNVLVWAESAPMSLDPQTELRLSHDVVMLNAYDSLYRNEENPPKLVPWLASGHTVSEDGRTWTFTLRPNIRFHDGSTMTADDVVYSFQRLLGIGRGPAAPFLAILKAANVTKVDDQTVRFVLEEPSSTFLAAIPLVSIVNPRLIRPNEKNGDWGTEWLSKNEAGSGAFTIRVDAYKPGQMVEYARFKDHFYGWQDNPRPIDIAKHIFIQEASTRVLSLLKGEIHTTDAYIPADQMERIARSKGVRVVRDETMRIMVITINNTRPPLNNVNFRRCLSYAFNYDGYISEVMKGEAKRNPAPLPQTLWGYPKDVQGYSFDLAKAKAECDKAKAAGAPIDREIEIHTLSNLAQSIQAAQLFQSDLKKLGITIRLVPSLFTKAINAAAKAETGPDMWVHWVGANYIDPDNWVGQMYDSQYHGTWKASSFYKNDEVDALLRRARVERDQEKRRPLYEEAVRKVVADAPGIWIYNTIQARGMSERLQGYKFTPVGSGAEFRWMHLSAR